MRLFELELKDARGLIKGKWNLPEQVTEFLKDSGYKLKARGSFSLVYEKPSSNYIVKVSMYQDTCAPIFYEYAYKNRGNPHLPRVSKVKYFTGENGNKFFLIMMEKLTPLNPNDFYHDTELNAFINYIDFKSKEDISRYPEAEQFKIHNPKFAAAILGIIKNHCNFDLHSGNFMKRVNGAIVITDPLYNVQEYENRS